MNTYSLCDLEDCINKENCKRYDKDAEVNQGYKMEFQYACEDSNYKMIIKKEDIPNVLVVKETKEENKETEDKEETLESNDTNQSTQSNQ